MKMTKALKKWLVDAGMAAADASDDEFAKQAAAALVAGTLTGPEYVKLSADPDAAAASDFERKLDAVLTATTSLTERMTALESRSTANVETAAPAATATTEMTKGTRSVFDRMFAAADGGVSNDPAVPSIRVVGAHERYSTVRTERRFPATTAKGMAHPYAGQRAFEGAPNGNRRFIDDPSELDKAVCGAYIKWALRSEKGSDAGIPAALRMTDHDRDLIQYALREMKWAGVIRGQGSEDDGAIGLKGDRLSDWHIKAILDDSTSGGLEVAPIVFDDMIIQIPILFGEFFPRVNVINITRGRRIEGGTIGNVTLSSGGADGTAIPLFNTASFIAAFDTTIFVVNGAIEIGMDFLSDSPVDVAGIVTAQYGQVLLGWLDTQVCVGDGTTEPEGVVNASGTTSVSSANGAAGPPTVGDYEGLLFGVAKNYKAGTPANRITYAGTETSYARARAIAVSTTDERRVFGMTHEDYALLGHPYGINESFTNQQILFVNWARYRMYRRLGLTIKVTTEGKELVRGNLALITARARYGGQLEDGGAAAVISDAQS